MEKVYEALKQLLWDEKKIVEYLFVIYKLFEKYGKSLYSFVEVIEKIDKNLAQVILFFKEENYKLKDIYNLLQFSIQKANYNIAELIIWKPLSERDIQLENTEIVSEEKDEPGLMVKTADGKIYKRFLLDDVKKLLW